MEHEQFDEALMQCIHTLRAGSDMDHAIQNLLEIIPAKPASFAPSMLTAKAIRVSFPLRMSHKNISTKL